MEAVFEKSGPLQGEMTVPGDKSISHRAAIVAALARGRSRISGYSPAGDCASTLDVLRQLGVVVEREGDEVLVEGRADAGFIQPTESLFAGNSGTTMRLMAGALAAWPIEVTLAGDESLSRRPMQRIIDPLVTMGAGVAANDAEGHPPLRVVGGTLHGIDYSPPVASAQVKSAVLLAGLGATGRTSVREIAKTRDHTERILQTTGIGIHRDGLAVAIEPGVPEARDLVVPGDVSSAAFLVAAALLCPGSDVVIRDVGLNPTRTGFVDLLRRMGAHIEVALDETSSWEPRGSIRAVYGPLKAIDVSPEDAALAIDEVTLIALLAARADGRTDILGAAELRHKESDRIAGTVTALRALGAQIEETPEGMAVEGPVELVGTRVSASGDHRLAMMLAVAGLVAQGRTFIEGWEWTKVSYPGFELALAGLGAKAG